MRGTLRVRVSREVLRPRRLQRGRRRVGTEARGDEFDASRHAASNAEPPFCTSSRRTTAWRSGSERASLYALTMFARPKPETPAPKPRSSSSRCATAAAPGGEHEPRRGARRDEGSKSSPSPSAFSSAAFSRAPPRPPPRASLAPGATPRDAARAPGVGARVVVGRRLAFSEKPECRRVGERRRRSAALGFAGARCHASSPRLVYLALLSAISTGSRTKCTTRYELSQRRSIEVAARTSTSAYVTRARRSGSPGRARKSAYARSSVVAAEAGKPRPQCPNTRTRGVDADGSHEGEEAAAAGKEEEVERVG